MGQATLVTAQCNCRETKKRTTCFQFLPVFRLLCNSSPMAWLTKWLWELGENLLASASFYHSSDHRTSTIEIDDVRDRFCLLWATATFMEVPWLQQHSSLTIHKTMSAYQRPTRKYTSFWEGHEWKILTVHSTAMHVSVQRQTVTWSSSFCARLPVMSASKILKELYLNILFSA